MEKIVDQIRALLSLEQEALLAYRASDPAHYNALVKQLHAHAGDQAINFGLEPRSRPLDDFEIMMYSLGPKDVLPRLLYKLSTFLTEDYGAVYAAYLSPANPAEGLAVYADCYVFQMGPDGLMTQALLQFDDLGRAAHTWVFTHGNEKLKPESLGPAQSVLRFQAPTTPANAIEDYLTDH